MRFQKCRVVGRVSIIVLTACAVFADEDSPKDAADGPLKELQGVWVLESIEIAGMKRTGDDLPLRFRGMRQVIEGDRMTVARVDGRSFECKIAVKEVEGVKQLDIELIPAQGESKTMKCIYKIEGGKLVVAEARTDRPKTFKTAPGSKTKISTFALKRRDPE